MNAHKDSRYDGVTGRRFHSLSGEPGPLPKTSVFAYGFAFIRVHSRLAFCIVTT